MSAFVTSAIAVLAIVAGSAPALADVDVVVHGSQALTGRDQKAVDACVSALIAKIAPGNTAPVHAARLPASSRTLSWLDHATVMKITVEGRSAGHRVLARSTCRVDYGA